MGHPGMIHSQGFRRSSPRLPPDALRLGGRAVLVTGLNVGLGLETAKVLATARGASLVVPGVRSVSRGEEVNRAVFAAAAAASPSGLRHPRLAPRPRELAQPRGQDSETAAVMGPAPLPIVAASVASLGLPPGAEALLLSSERAGAARRPGLLRQGEHARALRALTAAQRALGPRALATRIDLTRANIVVDAVNPGYCRGASHRSDPGAERLSRHFAWSAEHGAWRLADTKLWEETLKLIRREVEGVDLSESEDS
ncbi:hypothetical protein DL764_000546 [Monosporascus ibericus]|uniref:Uncharacterized protein n=1 Tax=Monosporascus ibericus TaxID=155417 RepID=A0A4Q4TSY3_9PEZI|nr:hypothetical protein DL764_000546 [Monosporascus ibericus]